MASCPKCNGRLRLTDWRQTCPHCSVNLVYYKSNEKLLDDSERAEIEHARTQPSIDRGKAAYAGSPLAIVRLILTILPSVTLLIPFARLNGAGGSKLVNLITVINYIRESGTDSLLANVTKDYLAAALALAAVSAAMFLINGIFLIASLGKHGRGRTLALYSFTFLLALGAVFCLIKGGGPGVFTSSYTSVSVMPGAFVYLAAEFAALLINIVYYAKKIPVKYTPCLIGGLPKEKYYEYVNAGMSIEQIRRKMLVALAEMQEEYDKKIETEEAKKAAERGVRADGG